MAGDIRDESTPSTDWQVSLIGGLRRHGRWTMRPRTLLVTLVGGAHLDLTETLLSSNDLILRWSRGWVASI